MLKPKYTLSGRPVFHIKLAMQSAVPTQLQEVTSW